MFSVGDFVVYGTNGVCQIKDITRLDLTGCNQERLYYVLDSMRHKGNQAFVPVETDRILLRPVIAKKDAEELLEDIPMIDGLEILGDKERETRYKELVKECECKEWIRILKTVYVRKRERVAQGKKMTATDERYMRIAQDNLYEELGFALGLDKVKAEACVTSKINIE